MKDMKDMKDMRYIKTPSTINEPWKNKQLGYDCDSSMSYFEAIQLVEKKALCT